LRVTKARPRPKPQDRKLLKFREDAATSSLLKKDLERVAVSTVRHSSSRKDNKKRGSSSLRCSEWRAKMVFQQAVTRVIGHIRKSDSHIIQPYGANRKP